MHAGKPPPDAGHVTYDARWEATSPRPQPPMNRMTDACTSITLPQTWFAGSIKTASSRSTTRPVATTGCQYWWGGGSSSEQVLTVCIPHLNRSPVMTTRCQ